MKARQRYNSMRLSSQGLIGTINAQNCPKSRFYREQLEFLIGEKAVITGRIEAVKKIKIQKRWVKRFLLREMSVLETPDKDPLDYGVTDHIWIFCEKSFLRRNRLNIGDMPVLEGFFYEYRRYDAYGNKLRNIGFRLNKAWSRAEYNALKSAG